MTRKRLWIVVAVLLAIVFSVWRWIGHAHTEADDQKSSARYFCRNRPAVARAERHNVGNTLTIAGEFKPFQDVNIHAKVAGYIKVIHVDVGDHVRQVRRSRSWKSRARRATRRRGCWRAALQRGNSAGGRRPRPGTIGARRQPLRLCPVETSGRVSLRLGGAAGDRRFASKGSRIRSPGSSSSAALSAHNSSFK